MDGHCVLGEHGACPDSTTDSYTCSCPCHLTREDEVLMAERKAFGRHYASLKERNADARKLRAEGWSVASSATSNPFTGERTYLLEAWTGDRRPDITMSDASGTRYGWTEV